MSMLSLPARPEAHLRQDRADLLAELEAQEKSVRGRAMTKAEKRDWDKTQDQIDDLTDQIEQQVRKKERMARKADARAGLRTATDDETNPFPVALQAHVNGETRSVTDATIMAYHQRALTSAGASDTINDQYKTGEYFIIDLQNEPLASTGIGYKIGVDQNESVVGFTPSEASLHAEGTEMPESTMLTKLQTFILKNFVLRFDIVNNVIRDAVTDWQRVIREGSAKSLDHKITQQFLFGAGGTEITGIDNVVGVQTVDAGSATLTWDMILQSVQKIIAANGSLDKISVIMSPVAWLQLQSLKDTTGQQITKPSGLDGVPMIVHTAVKNDYGVDDDETRVYVGDFSTCKLGVGGKYEITSEKSKADHDVTQFIMVYRADLQVFHPTRIVRIENVAIA